MRLTVVTGLGCIFLLLSSFSFSDSDSLGQGNQLSSEQLEVESLISQFQATVNQDPIAAFQQAKQALTLSKTIEYQSGIAYSLNNIGVIHQNIGNLDKALGYFQQSLKLHRAINNQDGIASTLGNIGIIYSRKSDLDRALNYFNEAHEIIEPLGDDKRMISSLSNLGNIYFDRGDIDQAKEYYARAGGIYQELDQRFLVFEPFTNLGNVHFQENNFDSALFYYRRSYDIEESNQSKLGQAKALHNIGITYDHIGNARTAIEYQMQALGLAQDAEANPIVMEVYKALSDIYFGIGDWRQAKDYLLLHIVTKDNIFNQESNRRIYELERTYELDQKESEIELLKKESEIQRLELSNNRQLIIGGVMVAVLLTLLALIYYLKNRANARIKALLQKQNKDIKDGIKYAQSVQGAILDNTSLKKCLPESFVFYKPKDIVSGDFYWHRQKNGHHILATVDCTGHGVAGAFMTVIGNSLLNQIVIENNLSSPAKILTKLDAKLKETLMGRSIDISNHSMDMAVCRIDEVEGKVSFAGAKSDLYTVKDAGMKVIKGDRDTVGDYLEHDSKTFHEKEVPFEKGQTFYLFSDGFSDQFGGDDSRKYMKKRFKKFLHSIATQPMAEQQKALDQELATWMGATDQTDDIMVVGFKLN